MNRFLCSLCLCALATTQLWSQHQFQATFVDAEHGEPLPGVQVYFPALERGVVSDADGRVQVLNLPSGSWGIQCRLVGFHTLKLALDFPLADSLQNQTLTLVHADEELETVQITSTRSTRTIADIPTRVEFIAGEELAEKAKMKPGDIRMLLNESTGIRTQQTSATSYNSSIRIQGLDGKYTQLLRDGLPLYGGYSGGLSLMQIAPLDLKQVEVIKGSNSTLYGGGAIAGLVNLVSKTPEEERELSFMINGTSALGLDLSSFYSERYGKWGTTVFASYNKGTAYDPAGIGLTAIPDFERYTLNPRLFYYPSDRSEFNLGFNFVTENRLGGNMDFIQGESVTNPYFERNLTDRFSTQFQWQYQPEEELRLTAKNSTNYFNRRIEVPGTVFSGRQFSTFSELNANWQQAQNEYVLGANLWTDRFDHLDAPEAFDLSFQDYTLGAFGQSTLKLASILTLDVGMRLDYHSDYGFFPLPRAVLMARPSSKLTLRLGGGMGYKAPTTFSEEAERLQFQQILPLNPADFEAENSLGFNFDLNYRMALGEELSLSTNALLFYTAINDPLRLQPQASAGGESVMGFMQTTSEVVSQGLELNLKWSYRHWKLFIGYTLADVQENLAGGSTRPMPLVAQHRLNNVLMYEKHGDLWLGLEAYYFSPQKLSDGSTGQAYWVTGVMAEKKINSWLNIFLNFENFLDTRQTAFDQIFTGDISNPDFREIYAPVDGFVVNGGFKLKF